MKSAERIIILFCLLVLQDVSVFCLSAEIEFSYSPGSDIWIKNSKIQLRFDQNMYCKVFYNKEGKMLSLNDDSKNDSFSLPSHFVQIDGELIKNFRVDYDKIRCSEINTNFGKGKRLLIIGIAAAQKGTQIEKKLTVELYDKYPDVAITFAEYKNLSASENFNLTNVYSNCFRLDASLVDPSLGPHEMHTFYGTNGRPAPQIDSVIPDDFALENYTGRTEDLEGIKKGNGGIPVVDIWCKKMGMAVGHIEPVWKNLYLPIKVQKDGKVMMAVREVPDINTLKPFTLHPGESFKTVRTFVSVHSLDFYAPMVRYSELLKRQGINMHSLYTDDDYLAAWCSWNTYCTTARQSKHDLMLLPPVMQRVKELSQFGIKQVIFDAGWFNNQGDWKPNLDARAFPNGDADLRKAIAEIHEDGLKVMLWISLLTADPWSDVAKAHPEWMIKKPNGQNHLDRWSGYTMCPSLPAVQEYYKKLADRLVADYGADAFKIDGMYTCPPCYNPAHNHNDPNESSEDFFQVFKAFYDEAKSINPKVTIMVCPCGTVCSFAILPYVSQTIAADPPNYITVRRFAKLYRALKGPNAPYSSDYTQVERGLYRLPTAIGCGAVPQTFYGKPLDKKTAALYKKWFMIYNREMISRDEYLNLYDIYYDKPETYVFRKSTPKGNVYYYSFYADDSQWKGKVALRGLEKEKTYTIIDYPNGRRFGTVVGSHPLIDIEFKNYLLIKCIPN